jgi:hypothetical protein
LTTSEHSIKTIGENVKNNLLSCKSAIAPLVILVIVIIAVAGIAAGAYILTQSPGPGLCFTHAFAQ